MKMNEIQVEKKDNFLQKIYDDLLTCHICFEEMKDPRVLHCQHVLCWNCVEACFNRFKVSTSRGWAFPCPYCKQLMNLPKKGLATMPKCLYVNFVRDVVEGYEICQSCEIASDNEMYICTDCSQPICSCCLLSHSERHHGRNLQLTEGNTVIEKIQSMLGRQEKDVFLASSACQDILLGVKEECTNLKDLTKKMEDLFDDKKEVSQSTMKDLENVIIDLKTTVDGMEKTTRNLDKAASIKETMDQGTVKKITSESMSEHTRELKCKLDGMHAYINKILVEVKKSSDKATTLFQMRTQDAGSLEKIKDIDTQILFVVRTVDGIQRQMTELISETNSLTTKNCGTLNNCWNTVKGIIKITDKLSKDMDKIYKTIDREREDIRSVMVKLIHISSDVKKLTRDVGQIKDEAEVWKVEKPWYKSFPFKTVVILFMFANLVYLFSPFVSKDEPIFDLDASKYNPIINI